MTCIFDQLLRANAVMIIAMLSCVTPTNHIKYLSGTPHMQIDLRVYPLTKTKVEVTVMTLYATHSYSIATRSVPLVNLLVIP